MGVYLDVPISPPSTLNDDCGRERFQIIRAFLDSELPPTPRDNPVYQALGFYFASGGLGTLINAGEYASIEKKAVRLIVHPHFPLLGVVAFKGIWVARGLYVELMRR
jgi:hypothetical protein